MEVQSDYETDLILAVFRTSEQAAAAVERLAQQRIHADHASQVVLPPGRYDLADGTLNEEMNGIVRGAEIGAPAGAVLGLGAAASLLGGPSPDVIVGLVAAGAFVGGVLGALEGAVLRARFDDDIAAVHHVPADTSEALLIQAAIVLAALVFERRGYRPTAPNPAALRPTGERFLDPTSGEPTEVWEDPATGAREYRPSRRSG